SSTRSALSSDRLEETRAPRTKPPQIASVVRSEEMPAGSTLRRTRCQHSQRLLKTPHRDDAKTVRILAGGLRIVPCWDEEDIHTRSARADHLLLDGSHRKHGPVEGELARRGDPAAVRDVAPEHACDLERERETSRRAADATEVDVDL